MCTCTAKHILKINLAMNIIQIKLCTFSLKNQEAKDTLLKKIPQIVTRTTGPNVGFLLGAFSMPVPIWSYTPSITKISFHVYLRTKSVVLYLLLFHMFKVTLI